jgi:hypothetical protein
MHKMEALQKHVTLSVCFLYFGLDKSRSLLLRPLVRKLSLNYPVDTGFLYNKGAMIRDKIKSRAGCFGLSQCPGINPEFRLTNVWKMFQINQPTRCNNFSGLLLDVYAYLEINMFPASSCPSSGAQQLQQWPLVLPIVIRDIVL